VRRVVLCALQQPDVVIFAGGDSAGKGQPTNRVDVLDVRTWKWSILSLRNATWGGVALGVADQYILITGGFFSSNKPSTHVEILNVKTMTWMYGSLSSVRHSVTPCTAGGYAMFSGGYPFTNIIDLWHVATNRWSTISMSGPRWLHAAIGYGNKAYLAGGSSSSSPADALSTIEILDVPTMTWTIRQLSVAREQLAAVVIGNNKIAFGGGQNMASSSSPTLVLATVDVLDIATLIVTRENPLGRARAALTGASLAGRGLFIGGLPGTGTDIDIYNPDGTTSFYGLQSASKASVVFGGMLMVLRPPGTMIQQVVEAYAIGSVVGYYTKLGEAPAYNIESLPCPPSTYGTVVGLTSCITCEPGLYTSSQAPTTCLMCPRAYICDGGVLQLCPKGRLCPDAGMSAPQMCPNGFYCNGSSIEATLCPSSTYCPLGSCCLALSVNSV
jgi:hypothetical protein